MCTIYSESKMSEWNRDSLPKANQANRKRK